MLGTGERVKFPTLWAWLAVTACLSLLMSPGPLGMASEAMDEDDAIPELVAYTQERINWQIVLRKGAHV